MHIHHAPTAKQSYAKRFRKLGSILTIAAMLSVFGFQYIFAPTVSAISEDQRKIFLDDIGYFNYDDETVTNQCAQTPAGGPANLAVGTSFSLGPSGSEANDLARRVNLVKALMADFGFTAEQASGIVGNFMHESGGLGLPPDVNEGGVKGPPAFSGGYGWAQWTGPRQREFISFATNNGYMQSSGVNATDAANYAFLKFELDGAYATSTLEPLRGATTPEDAATIFEAGYERAGVPALAQRTAYARQVFNEYNGGGAPAPGGAPQAGANGICNGAANLGYAGANVFPLRTNKGSIQNRNIFNNNTTNTAEHPYTAYDILVPTGTEVVAFAAGRVTNIGEDVCGGRLIGIYDEANNVVVSYLHLSKTAPHVQVGDVVQPGQRVGEIGTTAEGCTVPHLHIDVASGDSRPGCRRGNCPTANASKFIDIGPQLFQGFQALPE